MIRYADVTPPVRFNPSIIDKLKKWVSELMQVFIQAGFKGEFFNLELWVKEKEGNLDINLCEINPRCV